MRHTTIAAVAVLLSLALTGCIVDPNGSYGNRNYGDRGWSDHGQWQHHADHGQYRAQYGDANNR